MPENENESSTSYTIILDCAMVTCEIKLFRNNFEVISAFISRVTTVSGYM